MNIGFKPVHSAVAGATLTQKSSGQFKAVNSKAGSEEKSAVDIEFERLQAVVNSRLTRYNFGSTYFSDKQEHLFTVLSDQIKGDSHHQKLRAFEIAAQGLSLSDAHLTACLDIPVETMAILLKRIAEHNVAVDS